MQTITFSAFRNDQSLVQLTELLAAMPANDWVWHILEFEGMGKAPNDLSMQAFEDLARLNPQGYVMTWAELQDFAKPLIQTIFCLIVAIKPSQTPPSIRAKALENDFNGFEVVIDGFDSTDWTISTRHPEIMAKLACDTQLVHEPR